ncbi:MAG: hypothetical protein ACYC91_07175 [Solirubrobacteraceae bacterium]
MKIFEVPVICRSAAPETGFFSNVYFANTFGLGCVGGSLIYQQIQANLLPLLGNLIGALGAVPSIEQIVGFTAAIGSQYVRSLGARRPQTAAQVQLVVAGWCAVERALVAFEMHPVLDTDSVAFQAVRLDLQTPFFAGDKTDAATVLCTQVMEADQPGAPASRAPLNVLREFIEDPEATTIGGDVQVGFTVGAAFQRVRTLRPIPGHEPQAAFWLNAICTDDLPPVGPCALGLLGSVSP